MYYVIIFYLYRT